MKVQVDVTHPTTREQNDAPLNLVSWRVQQKPHSGDDTTWSDVGAVRAMTETSATLDNVPQGTYDFGVIWHDGDGQDSKRALCTLDVEPLLASPPSAGSVTAKVIG